MNLTQCVIYLVIDIFITQKYMVHTKDINASSKLLYWLIYNLLNHAARVLILLIPIVIFYTLVVTIRRSFQEY